MAFCQADTYYLPFSGRTEITLKKLISLILALLTIFALSLPVLAAECSHVYLRTPVEANCTEKSHILFTCRKCPHSYKVYDDEYTAPEGFYLLAESKREGSTLTLTVKLFNNPGLAGGRIQVGYNDSTLALREFINGEVWTEQHYEGGINLENNPFSVYTMVAKNLPHNYNNGTYFTVIFDILDSEGAYGINFSIGAGDFPGWDSTTNSVVKHKPQFISIVGKSDLGPHSYEETVIPPTCTEDGYTTLTCSVCRDSYTTDITKKTGHNFEITSVLKEPDFENEGEAEYSCKICLESKKESLPVLEHFKKGDLNNDGKINPVDSYQIKLIIVGYSFTLQEFDASDMDNNGKINSVDSYMIKYLIASGNLD